MSVQVVCGQGGEEYALADLEGRVPVAAQVKHGHAWRMAAGEVVVLRGRCVGHPIEIKVAT
jgi:microcystin-dependent protein